MSNFVARATSVARANSFARVFDEGDYRREGSKLRMGDCFLLLEFFAHSYGYCIQSRTNPIDFFVQFSEFGF